MFQLIAGQVPAFMQICHPNNRLQQQQLSCQQEKYWRRRANKCSRNKWSGHSEGKQPIKSTEQKRNEAMKETNQKLYSNSQRVTMAGMAVLKANALVHSKKSCRQILSVRMVRLSIAEQTKPSLAFLLTAFNCSLLTLTLFLLSLHLPPCLSFSL